MAFQKARALQEAEKLVSQGKIAQAIKQYQEILDKDPADVSLLNTVGDLYIRDRNVPEGLKQFQKLAEAYVREGFNVKAIAIYRKISKLDTNSVDTLLKLAELYQLQGLSREAREQYLQASEFFKKRNQPERAIEVLRKLAQLDPENLNIRNRLAKECEQAGKQEDAAQVYLQTAEICLRREDKAAAEAALNKAGELAPQNAKIQILRAQAALSLQRPEEAEKIITSSPELRADPAGKRILLDSYLASQNLPEAEKLVLEVFQAKSSEFALVLNVSGFLVDKGKIEEAFQLLSSVADSLISQGHGAPLLEALRRIWVKDPKHIPTLELIHRVCERTADELTLPEILEALGHAYEEANDLEKAEGAYLKLTDREPVNESYRGLLNAVQKKQGREVSPPPLAAKEAEHEEGKEPTPPPSDSDADRDQMVKEAFENSDLFARYNLPEKAIAELEKVLQLYPDQVEVHRRILEISRKGFPERGAAAAAQLARIFAEQGDDEMASKYRAIASTKDTVPEVPLPQLSTDKGSEGPAVPPSVTPASAGKEAPGEVPISIAATTGPDTPPPSLPPSTEPIPSFDLTPPPSLDEGPVASAPVPVATEEPLELDLSSDLEAMASFGFEAPASSPAARDTPPRAEIAPPVETVTVTEEPIILPVAIPAPPEEKGPPPMEVAVAPPTTTSPGVDEITPVSDAPPQTPVPEPALEEAHTAAELEDSRIEIEFYLENGFLDEAQDALAALAGKYPQESIVAEFRQRLQERIPAAQPALSPAQAAPSEQTAVPPPPVEEKQEEKRVEVSPPVEFEHPAEVRIVEPPAAVIAAEPEVAPLPTAVSVEEKPKHEEPPVEGAKQEPKTSPASEPVLEEEELEHEEWELPTSYAITAHPEAAKSAVPSPPAAAPPPPAPMVAAPTSMSPVEELVTVESHAAGMLGDLAGDMASSLDGLSAAAMPPPPPAVTSVIAPPPAGPAAQLSGLLAEMEEPGAAAAARGDPETHYNLGVAFREMGLLDEAIGEFQKVVKGSGRGNFPVNFLQACSLLAICFMEKKMPAIAVKWYLRALETPGLDEEALMALQYDLGLAYEQAGDAQNALERFTEVYSQNIDFRDVADKIRELQQKA